MCNHSFTYHSVVPPTHCPICGSCLGCGGRTAPMYPRPWGPYWQPSMPSFPTPNFPLYPTVTC